MEELSKKKEGTRKKISNATRNTWLKRSAKSGGSGASPRSQEGILNTPDEAAEELRKLTLQEIGGIAKNKGAKATINELLHLVSHLKQVSRIGWRFKTSLSDTLNPGGGWVHFT